MKSKRTANHMKRNSKRRTTVIPKNSSNVCKRIFNKIRNLFSKLIHIIGKLIKIFFKFIIKNINTLLLIFVILIMIKFLYVLDNFQKSLHSNINEMNVNYETKLNEKINELDTKTQEEIKNLENKISVHNKEKQEEQERQIQIAKANQEKSKVTSRGGTIRQSSNNQEVSGSKAEYQLYAKQKCSEYGWDSHFNSLVILWERESGWNPKAHNSSSGAHGIPQALPRK